MSWVGSEMWDVYLGLRSGAIAREGREPTWSSHADTAAACAAVIAEIPSSGTLRRLWRRPQLRVWLCGALARPFVIQWPEGLVGAGERLRLAQSVARTATGLQGDCAIWLSDRRGSKPSLAVALDKELRDIVARLAANRGLNAISIRPWWSKVLQREAQRTQRLDLLVVADDDSLTLLASQSDQWVSADSYVPVSPGPHSEALIARRMLSLGLEADALQRVRRPAPVESRSSSWVDGRLVTSFAQP